jgi:hypothetical protein
VRKGFPDLPSELDELEFRAQQLEADCVFHPNFSPRPLDRRQQQPKMPF